MKWLLVMVGMLPVLGFSQGGSFKIGTQIPIQYAVQYDYRFQGRMSANVQLGILTKPYDQIILDVLKAFGTDQEIVNVLTHSFDYGIITQAGLNYHFKKNYVGATASWIHLRAADAPTAAVEAAFNVSVSSYPTRPKQSGQTITMTLQSDLYTAGILYGRRFTFKNPRIELHTEFSFAKVMGSQSYVDSQQRNLATLSVQINKELQSTYVDYGFLPSLNVFFVYKLRKS